MPIKNDLLVDVVLVRYPTLLEWIQPTPPSFRVTYSVYLLFTSDVSIDSLQIMKPALKFDELCTNNLYP